MVLIQRILHADRTNKVTNKWRFRAGLGKVAQEWQWLRFATNGMRSNDLRANRQSASGCSMGTRPICKPQVTGSNPVGGSKKQLAASKI
jgi:hypothetical protein